MTDQQFRTSEPNEDWPDVLVAAQRLARLCLERLSQRIEEASLPQNLTTRLTGGTWHDTPELEPETKHLREKRLPHELAWFRISARLGEDGEALYEHRFHVITPPNTPEIRVIGNGSPELQAWQRELIPLVTPELMERLADWSEDAVGRFITDVTVAAMVID